MPRTARAAHAPPELLAAQRPRLWGLAYRLTGSASDADDVVQEALTRFLERPPAPDRPAHAWLVRVTVNLALDAIRDRRRRAYPGPWLPDPVESGNAERRIEQVESASYAFLVALEALRPRERAVLILRDVLGWSAAESADLLGMREGTARVVHLRARRTLESFQTSHPTIDVERRAQHRAVLEKFLAALLTQDVEAVESLLAESVTTTTDAGGEYTALAETLVGRARVARFSLQASRMRRDGEPRIAIAEVNGLAAAAITLGRPVRRQAPHTLLVIDLGAAGQIAAIYSVLAPAKLGAVTFPV